MLKTTPGRIEGILRKYALQLARQKENLSADQVQTISRLASSLNRLNGSPKRRMEPERNAMEDGDVGFYEELSIGDPE